MRLFRDGIGPKTTAKDARQIPPQGGRRASDLVPQAHNGDQADPGMEQGFGGRLHDSGPPIGGGHRHGAPLHTRIRGSAGGGSRGNARRG